MSTLLVGENRSEEEGGGTADGDSVPLSGKSLSFLTRGDTFTVCISEPLALERVIIGLAENIVVKYITGFSEDFTGEVAGGFLECSCVVFTGLSCLWGEAATGDGSKDGSCFTVQVKAALLLLLEGILMFLDLQRGGGSGGGGTKRTCASIEPFLRGSNLRMSSERLLFLLLAANGAESERSRCTGAGALCCLSAFDTIFQPLDAVLRTLSVLNAGAMSMLSWHSVG